MVLGCSHEVSKFEIQSITFPFGVIPLGNVWTPKSFSALLFFYKDVRGAFNKFLDFFVQAFKIVVESWKFSILLLYILWDDWPIVMISGLNEQLEQELEYTPRKLDCHTWVNLKNAIWTFGLIRRTICNRIVLNLEKMPQKHMECFRLLFDHLAWIDHQFLSGIRDSRKTGSLWGMMRGVGGVRKS